MKVLFLLVDPLEWSTEFILKMLWDNYIFVCLMNYCTDLLLCLREDAIDVY